MYNLRPQEFDNDQPWLLSFSSRVHSLLEAKESGLNVALYLYEGPDTSTFRYRVYNIHQSLELSLHWRSVYFYRDELQVIENYLNKIDLLIVARFRWSFELQRIIDRAKELQIKVAFEIDDMVYHLKYLPTIVNTLSVSMNDQADYDYWFAYISRMQTAASKCDAVITTNDFLAHKMHEDLNIPAYVIQNYLNRLQEDVSDKYYKQKQALYSTGNFEIGYFSGTPSHINDFLMIAPELKLLLEKYDDITLKLVGFMELPPFMAELEATGKIKRIPLVNFIELQKEIAESDVNIVPLVNNEFSNCKSELKFYEAAIVGTITCATPSFVFREAIQNGITGYLCDRGHWFDTLENLYLNRRHINHDMVHAAREYCITRYAYYNQIQHLEETFDALIHQF